jgi:lysophospholipase
LPNQLLIALAVFLAHGVATAPAAGTPATASAAAASAAAGTPAAGTPAAAQVDTPQLCGALPDEASLRGRYGEIQAFWRATVEEGIFTSNVLQSAPDDYRVAAAVPIAYAIARPPGDRVPRGNIVIASGRTESYVKYKEMALDLWCKGFGVYLMDHRGQGLSGRVLVYTAGLSELVGDESPVQYGNRGHVEDFDHYVMDFRQFIDALVPTDAPRILLAHSMGGAIGTRLIQQLPGTFDLAILSSPMLGMTGQFACPALSALEGLAGADHYIPGGGPWDQQKRYPYRDELPFMLMAGWHYTGSAVRYDLWHEEYADLVERIDGVSLDLRIGAPTVGWLLQACSVVDRLMEEVDRMDIPVLLLLAEDDTMTSRRHQEQFCNRLNRLGSGGSQCRSVLFEDARHEMFIERDAVRKRLLATLYEFISQQLPDTPSDADPGSESAASIPRQPAP